MPDFFAGLTKEEQQRYKELSEKFRNTEDMDEKKKYIPYLNLLAEKGRQQIQKGGETDH